MGDVLGLEEIDDNCRKMAYIQVKMMDRGFTDML